MDNIYNKSNDIKLVEDTENNEMVTSSKDESKKKGIFEKANEDQLRFFQQYQEFSNKKHRFEINLLFGKFEINMYGKDLILLRQTILKLAFVFFWVLLILQNNEVNQPYTKTMMLVILVMVLFRLAKRILELIIEDLL